MKRSEVVFLSDFKKLTFARLLSLKFSSKFSWCSPVPFKFESYNLQHWKKNCRKLIFWVFSEQIFHQIIFWRLHFLLFVKNKRKNFGRFESLMFAVELLVNSVVVCIVTLCFEHAQHFHISHFTYHLRYYMIIDHC